MNLVVLTPERVVVDREITHVRAEDASGAFGILEGHIDLLTALTISVLVHRDLERREHFVAVRGGLLSVTGRRRVEVLTREAVEGDDLERLRTDVLARFRRATAEEQRARAGARELEIALTRRVADYVNLGRRMAERRDRWRT